MKTFLYQIREGNKHWDEIGRVAMWAKDYDEAAEIAKNMANANGKEVRMTEFGSYQGHYFRPDIANIPTKVYYEQSNIGTVKYVVNHYNGAETHKDGSPFYAISTFSNKKKKEAFIRVLKAAGYRERGSI